jgi:hypothetical protein
MKMIFIIYRDNYKQIIRDGEINHIFLIDKGMVTVKEKIKNENLP